jgi:tRNA 2-thiouridine synthesizing protein C
MASKKILLLNRSAPHASSKAQEALDVLLMASAFDQQITVVFMDDGVFQLKSNQNTQARSLKNFSQAFKALSLYEIENIFVDEDSLASRGLKKEDLMINVELVNTQKLTDIFKQQDAILNF